MRDLRAPDRWVLAATVFTWACMLAPPLRDARLDSGGREAWRRDILVSDPGQVAASLASGDRRILILDVREAPEFAQYHIPTALNIPLREIPSMDLADCLQADLVIPCSLRDFRAFDAAHILRARGLSNVALLEGFGLEGWNDTSRLPLAGDESGMSDDEVLERIRALSVGSALEGLR